MSRLKKISSLTQLQKEVKSERTALKALFQKLKSFIPKEKSSSYQKLLKKERDRQQKLSEAISSKVNEAEAEMELFIKKEKELLQRKIVKLRQAQDSTEANNYLLERKRKDLLLQTEEMEAANEKIIAQNKDLLEQKHQIAEQVEELTRTREEILEKKNEIEEKMNALLDQADYLHEANQVISNMHAELAKQKDEILGKNKELLALNQEKNNLIGIVAHDLKSPLNQIKGLMSIIRMTSTQVDKESDGYLSMVELSVKRMTDMISKILDIEAIEAQTLNLHIQPINPDENLKMIVDRFRISAEEKNIRLTFASESNCKISADISYFNQVFENLISNAIKFSPTDKNIWVSVDEKNSDVIISVKDEGPGLSDDDKKKLFNKYQKLSARPTGNESSTGLGLSIVKKYVEAMKGKIWCESEQGKGATFRVQFAKI
jgi:signal transduction histidine kinase